MLKRKDCAIDKGAPQAAVTLVPPRVALIRICTSVMMTAATSQPGLIWLMRTRIALMLIPRSDRYSSAAETRILGDGEEELAHGGAG